MSAADTALPNIAVFPMEKPEMQIVQPDVTKLPDVPEESEFTRNTQTWD